MESQIQQDRKWKVLLGATGSVASIKLLELVTKMQDWAEIRIILTQSAKPFIQLGSFLEQGIKVYCDQDQKKCWSKRGDPVLHIQLRKWADVMLIAPLSANTLAKMANGFCDNLLTLVCRCWNMQPRTVNSIVGQNIGGSEGSLSLINPLIVCPAMNTMMWSHPITSEHVRKLESWGITIVPPIEKLLMCGDSGVGAMNDVQTIIGRLKSEMMKVQSKRVNN